MSPIVGFVVGLLVTIILIPPLTRIATPLGLFDRPGLRKIHDRPVPCIGGIAIFGGVLLPVLLWLPFDEKMAAYIIGSVIIVSSGIWDDLTALDYKPKLSCQLVAALVLIYAGVRLEHLPFFGFDPVSPWISIPVTILFLLAVTNAVNLFDGLDGLAGGCMLLSLGCVAFLAQVVDGQTIAILSLATMGAIAGFLYFNTYPAQIFMGDAGSQFLGFTLATVTILLVHDVHTALNPTMPLLIIGLPLLDTLWVFSLRILQRRSPFKGDRQHIHHQLLGFGCSHAGAVSLVYAIQALMVTGAITLRYQSDAAVFGTFAAGTTLFLGLLLIARKRRWHWGGAASGKDVWRISIFEALGPRIYALRPMMAYAIEILVSAFLLIGATFSSNLEFEYAGVALGAAGMLAFSIIFLRKFVQFFTRIAVYVAGLLALLSLWPVTKSDWPADWAVDTYFGILVVCLATAIRVSRKDLFQVTPQDLLIAVIAIALPNLPAEIFGGVPIGYLFIRAAILFYACEYLVSLAANRLLALRYGSLSALLVESYVGLSQ